MSGHGGWAGRLTEDMARRTRRLAGMRHSRRPPLHFLRGHDRGGGSSGTDPPIRVRRTPRCDGRVRRAGATGGCDGEVRRHFERVVIEIWEKPVVPVAPVAPVAPGDVRPCLVVRPQTGPGEYGPSGARSRSHPEVRPHLPRCDRCDGYDGACQNGPSATDRSEGGWPKDESFGHRSLRGSWPKARLALRLPQVPARGTLFEGFANPPPPFTSATGLWSLRLGSQVT